MASQPLSYADTVNLALEILREGRNPSASAIVTRAGRGSKTTALKHLEQWRSTLETTGFVMPVGIPDGLSPAIEQLWNEALRSASQAFDQEQNRLAAEAEQAQQAQTEAEQQARAAEQETKALQQQVAYQARHIEDLEQQIRDQRAEVDRLGEEVRSIRTAAEERESQLRSEYDREREQERSEHERVAAAYRERIEDLEKQIQRWEQRYDETEAHWLQEVANARHATEKANAARASDQARFDQERRMLNEQITQKGGRLTQLENRLTQLQQKADREEELQSEVQRLRHWIDRMTERGPPENPESGPQKE